MSYTTVEVELDHGRVWPRGAVTLPVKAHALLTVLEPSGDRPAPATRATGAGLRRFLSTPDFALTPEQFRANIAVDFFEQRANCRPASCGPMADDQAAAIPT